MTVPHDIAINDSVRKLSVFSGSRGRIQAESRVGEFRMRTVWRNHFGWDIIQAGKTAKFLGLTLVLLLTVSGVSACGIPASERRFLSMAEVCKTPDGMEPVLVALGQYVGDGREVVTVLNYEEADRGEYDLDNLWVNGQRERAVVRAWDPRTGATLLSISKAGMATADVGNATLRSGQDVTILQEVEPSGFTDTIAATVVTSNASSLFFEVAISAEAEQALGGRRPGDGAAVIDGRGQVLGLVGPSYSRLAPDRSSTELVLQVVRINGILDLRSRNIAQEPWADGPAVSALATSSGVYGYTSGVLTTPEDFDKMAAAVQTLMGQLGRPIVGSELPNDYSTLVKDFPKAADGSLLTLVYPGSVALVSAESAAVVHASWIGVHWGRNENKPNVVYYGFTPYLVAGGFTITGDISAVVRSVLGQS